MSAVEFPEVRIATGVVRGRREAGLAVFRGIPFAEAPVGELRFAAPRPARGWDGVREAYAFGPPPPQEPLGRPGPAQDRLTGDDWLTVNVWSPDTDPAARRPVMVWIYGGAYKFGSADDPAYDGRRLAEDGNVVLVTFNHRVGMEGFAQIEGAPANRGLLDQVAALEWVRDNIAAFGGDPGRVTVFGESAGAGSIAALMVMERARGLFGRAIAQSVPGTYFSTELASDVAAVLAAEVGLRPTVADLRGVDPHKLTAAGAGVSARMAQYADRWGPVEHTPTPYSPVVDGEVLPTAPWEALAAGAARDIELIAGHNRDEFRLFVAVADLLGRIDAGMASAALRSMGPGDDIAARETAYRAAHPGASAEKLFELVHSDWLFRMPSLHLAEAQVAGGGRAYLYDLTWPAPTAGGLLGACHGLDVPLVFGCYAGLGQGLIGAGPSPEAEALSAHFRTAWTAFATTGDPGWSPYDPERRLTKVFDTTPTEVPYPEEASRRLWEEHVFAAVPLR
ncbi:carboxylesterase/lipase family protein [Streptomyces sp. NPDC002643]